MALGKISDPNLNMTPIFNKKVKKKLSSTSISAEQQKKFGWHQIILPRLILSELQRALNI